MVNLCLFFAALVIGVEQTEKKDTPIPKLEIKKDAGDITGYYTCNGLETSGKKYSGVVVIEKRGEVYLIQWNCGGSSFLGVAIRQGDILSASWTIPSDNKGMIRGVNMYRIEPGPRLVGRWASIPGNGLLQNETLIFLKKIDKEDDDD